MFRVRVNFKVNLMVRISFLVRERVNIRDLAIQFVDKKTPCQFGGCKQVFQTDRPVYPLISLDIPSG